MVVGSAVEIARRKRVRARRLSCMVIVMLVC